LSGSLNLDSETGQRQGLLTELPVRRVDAVGLARADEHLSSLLPFMGVMVRPCERSSNSFSSHSVDDPLRHRSTTRSNWSALRETHSSNEAVSGSAGSTSKCSWRLRGVAPPRAADISMSALAADIAPSLTIRVEIGTARSSSTISCSEPVQKHSRFRYNPYHNRISGPPPCGTTTPACRPSKWPSLFLPV
jgi:hypothetical protein